MFVPSAFLDRVFGLLGLLDGEVPETIKPDYRKPVQDIMIEATKLCFMRSGWLDCNVLVSRTFNEGWARNI